MSNPMAFGIDFGTSTSEIACFADGSIRLIPDLSSPSRSPIVPSLIAINPGGNLLIGEAARAMVDSPGRGVREVKRLLGSGKTVNLRGVEYRPEELAAVIMRKLKSNAERLLQQDVSEVVLSVPAMFPDHARQATLNAGELAGLKIINLINEPTAAALAFGIDNLDTDEKVAVFDFGGGTLDITILEMAMGVIDVRASYGEAYLGGKDFDEAMIKLVLAKFESDCRAARVSDNAVRRLKAEAENAKIALSTSDSVWVQMPAFAADTSGHPVDLVVEVTKSEFERACEELHDKVRHCIASALKAARVDVRDIGRVLLVGGTTYMPSVRTLVAEAFGQMPSTDVDPDLAVAKGACAKAACELGIMAEGIRPTLAEVAAHGLGIVVMSTYSGFPALMYDPLIAPNQPIPYSVSRDYALMFEDQDIVRISLYQSLESKALPINSPGITDINVSGTIMDIPPSETGNPHPVRVDFTYGMDGMARLHACIPATGQSLHLLYAKTDARLDADGMVVSRTQVEELWKLSPRYRDCRSLIERAELLIGNEACPMRNELALAVAALKAALEDGGEARIDDCEDRLTSLLMNVDAS